MLHGKMIVIDQGFCLVGSANFDVRSLLYNFEIGVLLSSDAEIQKGEHWQRGLFEASARTLPPAGYFRDLAEGIGRVFGPVI
jgi:cardiolipin synthase